MLVSYRWLNSFTKFDMSVDEIVECLTSTGLEIEGVLDMGAISKKIFCGRLLEKEQHPNADSLSLCKVDIGTDTPLRIVCGAKNHKVGDMIPVAVEGAILPGDFKIKKSKIRGETSEGMMCSARELGLGDDHEGLMILPQDWIYKLGDPFDAIIDIKVTPNRADALSLIGVARDLAAFKRKPLPMPDCAVTESDTPTTDLVSVSNRAFDACPRYLGRVINNVKIQPSPLWLQRAVETSGIRSINNVVDVTNYIMMEMGHPLHAFDLNKMQDKTVLIRMAEEGEKVITLDGAEYTMKNTDLLIADSTRPIALAGIMGCGNTEIDDNTTDVFLECAYFTPTVVRATAKRLCKSTDSSYRFERGTDPQALDNIIDRAAALIASVTGGQVARETIKQETAMAPPESIAFSPGKVKSLLGMDIAPEEIISVLTSLGFSIEDQGNNNWLVTPPTFRGDIFGAADLVEEVARILGFDNLPATLPVLESRAIAPTKRHQVLDTVRDTLTGLGINEARNYSFIDEPSTVQAGFDVQLRLANPLNADYAILRPSLVPGLLKSALYNLNRGQLNVNLFEVGGVWDGISQTTPPAESWQFAAILSGCLGESSWNQNQKGSDFFTTKAIAKELVCALGIDNVTINTVADVKSARQVPEHLFHPGRSAAYCSGNKPLIFFGELHPRLSRDLGFKKPPMILFGWMDSFEDTVDARPVYKPISQFPSMSRDLALVAQVDVSNAAIENVIIKRAKSLLKEVRLFDVYQGEHIAKDKKSLAYSLTFAAVDRTLTDDEVNKLIEKILADLKTKLDVDLRS